MEPLSFRAQGILACAGVLACLMLLAIGFWAGSARGDDAAARAVTQPLPDWFLPIWDAYDRNPAITPEFDFSALYSGRLDD